MSSLSARASQLPLWIWPAVFALGGGWLRIHNIAGPAAFVDEGANILTALDPRVLATFEPLEQGRPWLAQLFRPAGWAPAFALEIARLMTTGAGLITLSALGWTLNRLSGRAAALCGMALWAAMPLAVFHERIALQDPFVTALLALILGLVVAGSFTAQISRIRLCFLCAGILFGAAFLLKISCLLALPWFGLIYAAIQQRNSKKIIDRRIAWMALGGTLPLLTLGPDLIRLGSHLGSYNALPALTISGFFPGFIDRLSVWLSWYVGYGSWPLLLILVTALFFASLRRDQLTLSCALGWLISIPVAGLIYNNTYARYILPDQLPLVLFASLAFGSAFTSRGYGRLVAVLVPALSCAVWGYKSSLISTRPTQGTIPAREVEQYLTGRWSGRGIDQIIDHLKIYSEKYQINCMVLTHRFHRPGCYGLMLAELSGQPIHVIPLTVYEPSVLAMAKKKLHQTQADRRYAFFLLYEGSRYPAPSWLDETGSPAHLVKIVNRCEGETFRLYQFEP